MKLEVHFFFSAAHTPDNSFMGFVTEELNQTERFNIKRDKVNNMAVVYGKEASMWKVRKPVKAVCFPMVNRNSRISRILTLFYIMYRQPCSAFENTVASLL